jgi:2'-5' RNA ligase
MDSSVRAFLSIDVDNEPLLSRITHIQTKLDREAAKLKLVEKENIHFTLRFFGDIPMSQIDVIQDALKGISFGPFTIQLEGVGAFPNVKRPRVVWIGVTQNADKMRMLKIDIDGALATLGYSIDRKFSTHATIARVRAIRNRDNMIRNLESVANESVGTMVVDCFRMTKSTLTSSGPIYETLWEIKGM